MSPVNFRKRLPFKSQGEILKFAEQAISESVAAPV
jgi:hypothetical protein